VGIQVYSMCLQTNFYAWLQWLTSYDRQTRSGVSVSCGSHFHCAISLSVTKVEYFLHSHVPTICEKVLWSWKLSGDFDGRTLVQPPWIRRIVFYMPFVCLSMYVWMCAPLAPEQFDRFTDILYVRFIRHRSVPGGYEHSGSKNKDRSDESLTENG
jgi:hypothetical protein